MLFKNRRKRWRLHYSFFYIVCVKGLCFSPEVNLEIASYLTHLSLFLLSKFVYGYSFLLFNNLVFFIATFRVFIRYHAHTEKFS